MVLRIKKVDDVYWIVDGEDLYGPYNTKKEATEDKRGIETFYKHESEPGFVTIESDRTGRID